MCVCVQFHTCVGVRPPLGVPGPVRGSLWGTDPHLSAGGQPPSPSEGGTFSGCTLPTVGGPAPRHDSGLTSQEG